MSELFSFPITSPPDGGLHLGCEPHFVIFQPILTSNEDISLLETFRMTKWALVSDKPPAAPRVKKMDGSFVTKILASISHIGFIFLPFDGVTENVM